MSQKLRNKVYLLKTNVESDHLCLGRMCEVVGGASLVIFTDLASYSHLVKHVIFLNTHEYSPESFECHILS